MSCVCTLSPCTCIRISRALHPSGTAKTGTHVISPPLAQPTSPPLDPWALMKLIQVVNFYQSKRFAIFICRVKERE